MKTFEEYEEFVKKTRQYSKSQGIMYVALALGGEVGEVQNEIKKMYRDDDLVLTPERHIALLKELGDVLWYLSSLTNELGSTLEEIALINQTKLSARYKLVEEGHMTYSGNDFNEPWEGSMFGNFGHEISWNVDEDDDYETDSDDTTAIDVPETQEGSEGTNL